MKRKCIDCTYEFESELTDDDIIKANTWRSLLCWACNESRMERDDFNLCFGTNTTNDPCHNLTRLNGCPKHPDWNELTYQQCVELKQQWANITGQDVSPYIIHNQCSYCKKYFHEQALGWIYDNDTPYCIVCIRCALTI